MGRVLGGSMPGRRRRLDSRVGGRRTPGTVFTAIVSAAVLILVGCGSPDGSPDDADGRSHTVMATTPIWADVVSSVTCNTVEVESMAPPGSDSHDFELSMRSADRLLGASLVFANGLDLETDLASVFERATEAGVPVVELADGLPDDLPPIDGDPHMWTDPGTVRALVPFIEERLASLDLMDRDELHSCAEEYSTTLGDLIEAMKGTLAVVGESSRKLVGEHRNLGYFAREFDFEVLGAMIESASSLAEADTRHLDSLRAAMQREGVSTVFIDVADSDSAASSFVSDVSEDGVVVGLYLETMPAATDVPDDGRDTDGGPFPGGVSSDDLYVHMMWMNAQRVAAALRG